MAAKKTVTVKETETKATPAAAPAVKAEEKKAEVKATPVETAPAEETKEVKEEAKAAPAVTEKKKPGRKPKSEAEKAAAKATKTTKAAKTVKEEKAEEPKTTKAGRPKNIVANVQIQFNGKSYSNADLIEIVKNVWQYDLNRDVKEIKTVDLYVKPEEQTAYYVVNDTEHGSFGI